MIALSAISLLGCATKEKAETNSRERLHSSNIHKASADMKEGRLSTAAVFCMSEAENETDSVVQKLQERIVTDSCGHLVAHEKVLTQERYKGKGKRTAASSNQNESAKITSRQASETNNSISVVENIRQTTLWNKHPSCWLFLYIIIVILICRIIGNIDKKGK